MGMGVFSNPDGCGRGEGIVHLRITYTPFTAFQRHPADSITVRTLNADPESQLCPSEVPLSNSSKTTVPPHTCFVSPT